MDYQYNYLYFQRKQVLFKGINQCKVGI